MLQDKDRGNRQKYCVYSGQRNQFEAQLKRLSDARARLQLAVAAAKFAKVVHSQVRPRGLPARARPHCHHFRGFEAVFRAGGLSAITNW